MMFIFGVQRTLLSWVVLRFTRFKIMFTVLLLRGGRGLTSRGWTMLGLFIMCWTSWTIWTTSTTWTEVLRLFGTMRTLGLVWDALYSGTMDSRAGTALDTLVLVSLEREGVGWTVFHPWRRIGRRAGMGLILVIPNIAKTTLSEISYFHLTKFVGAPASNSH